MFFFDKFIGFIAKHPLLLRFFWNKKTRSLSMWFMQHLPINHYRAMFVSREGMYYSCNPKALADSMCLHQEWQTCVGVLNPSKYSFPAAIQVFEIGSFEYYYYLFTSRYFVTNERISVFTYPKKRPGQTFIQTLHGGPGIKKTPGVALQRVEDLWAYTDACQDVVLSNSSFFTDTIRNGFHFQQPVLEFGLPRNDVFFSKANHQQEYKQQIFDFLSIKADVYTTRMLVYAPTFRYDNRGTKDLYDVDLLAVLQALESRFGQHWIVVVSAHPFIPKEFHEMYDYKNDQIFDGAEIPDVQDLLMAADALITDYSSIEMDFMLTRRPQFQFFVDGAEWKELAYVDPKKLPFPYAENNQQLCQAIQHFDEQVYLESLLKFQHEILHLTDNGHASERVIAWMKEHA